jgi:hypothetical protein
VSKKTVVLLSFAIIISCQNNVMAQNYWGDNHIQPLTENPNPVIKQAPPKHVVELPDVPALPKGQQVINNQNEKLPEVYEYDLSSMPAETSSKSPVLELGASSEKVPVGTKLDIVLNTNLNAKKNKEGDPFSATIKNDVMANNNVVMPAGTLIRGRIGKVKKPGFFSKSGSVILNFDHIVTPLGKHITLDVDLSNENQINKKGALVGGHGFAGALKDSAKAGFKTTKVVTKAGYDVGMAAGKVPVVATAPVGAAVGTLAGTTVFATKSAIAIFNKGGNLKLNSGDMLEITFSEDIDVPVN